uniref:GSKIP domain-containing protein n=1 Tax=Romanomermis culicivorax TaxID=13658 RepID=A0A915IBT1_ROMCU
MSCSPGKTLCLPLPYLRFYYITCVLLLDVEMMRPAAKALVQAQAGNSVAPFLCDANAFADVLGISPVYRQKERVIPPFMLRSPTSGGIERLFWGRSRRFPEILGISLTKRYRSGRICRSEFVSDDCNFLDRNTMKQIVSDPDPISQKSVFADVAICAMQKNFCNTYTTICPQTFRWSCAMLMYKQMSYQDLTKNLDVSGDRSTIMTPTDIEQSFNRPISISECPSPVRTFAVQKHKNFNFLKYKSNQSHVDQLPTSSTFSTSSELLQLKNADRSSNGQGSANTGAAALSPMIGNLFRSASSNDTRRLAGDGRQSLADNMNESLNALELEAIAAVHELQFAVKDIFVSELLPRTSDLIFLNITTAEGQPYCVELTKKGWRVTSLRHDCMNGDISNINLHVLYFETIYSLMDAISKRYRESFSGKLTEKLSELDDKNVDLINDNSINVHHLDAGGVAASLA